MLDEVKLSFVVLDGGASLRFCRVYAVEFPVALFDAPGSLVPKKGGTDVVWARALACSGDFLLRLANRQGKNSITEAR